MQALPLLSPQAALLLRAVSHEGEEAVSAFTAWRAMETLDLAHGESHRVLPLLVELIAREGLTDPDVARMRGVAKQVWTHNVLRLRLLFDALDLLEGRGITPVLMKGAALFARAPELERRRVSNDYDILVPPGQLPEAVRVLRDNGFDAPGHAWDDVGPPLLDSVEPGIELRRGLQRGLDFHWRPLWNIRDRAYGEAFLGAAQPAMLHGRPVRIPDATHQLFCAMARCEPWDRVECFTRVVEAHFLLLAAGSAIDWPRLEALVERYGLQCAALAFLHRLADTAGHAVPAATLQRLAAAADAEKRREWQIRAVAPAERRSSEQVFLQQRDVEAGRAAGGMGAPTAREARLRDLAPLLPRLKTLWRLARQRLGPVPQSEAPVFLEGFSSPEAVGRWTEGHWAMLVLPLSPAQQAGEAVRLNASVFRGRRARTRLLAQGGRGTAVSALVDRETEADIAIRVLPLPELGGRGLVLFFLPDATAPVAAGQGTDRRQLGLLIRRQWDRSLAEHGSAPVTRFVHLRRAWRRLPLPAGLRQSLAPALGRLVRRILFHRLAAPLPPAGIQPGNLVVSGFLTDVSGIGRAGRLTVAALGHWPAERVTHDLRADPHGETVEAGDGGIWICHCNAPEAAHAMLSGTAHIWARRYRIGIWAYELEQLPADWKPVLSQFHEIWAPSAFVASAIRGSITGKGPNVRIVPHPFPAASPAPRSFPAGRPFRFLAMFDMRSTPMRKNPLGAIRAFQKAFEPQDRGVDLLVKVVEARFDEAACAELAHAAAGWPNIRLLREQLNDAQTLALIAQADCLVSLHRSEGFGLTVAEAMACGTPAIVTGWSAPTEFSAGAALAVGFRLIPVSDPSGRYDGLGARWADPDIDEAAAAMRRLATDEALWLSLSETGRTRAAEAAGERWPMAPYARYLRGATSA